MDFAIFTKLFHKYGIFLFDFLTLSAINFWSIMSKFCEDVFQFN